MTTAHGLELTTVNIGAPDPGALARFYETLLGWQIRAQESGWVVLKNPDGGATLVLPNRVVLRPTCLARRPRRPADDDASRDPGR